MTTITITATVYEEFADDADDSGLTEDGYVAIYEALNVAGVLADMEVEKVETS